MMNFIELSNLFFSKVACGEIEIYNEFSLQHEFGIFLRKFTNSDFRIQFERAVSYFGINRAEVIKKEIDIVIFTPDRSTKFAIELKYPRNGQHPEQIYRACEDICFLEQLRRSGFTRCWFMIVVEDRLFYSHGERSGIYGLFRGGVPIHGKIQKPTGLRDGEIMILGNHRIVWKDIVNNWKYSVIEI
jgi:hypothetical protein